MLGAFATKRWELECACCPIAGELSNAAMVISATERVVVVMEFSATQTLWQFDLAYASYSRVTVVIAVPSGASQPEGVRNDSRYFATAAELVLKLCKGVYRLSFRLEASHTKLMIGTLAQWIATSKKTKMRSDFDVDLSGGGAKPVLEQIDPPE